MLENLIKAAVCQIKCGADSGTGWLVSPEFVLTAKHCVSDAIDAKSEISLLFFGADEAESLVAEVAGYDDELDVALLKLSQSVKTEPLRVSNLPPREGGNWLSFGYPHQKAQIGHRLTGSISQVLAAPVLRMDIDLVVDPACALSVYSGLSGSPLMVDGECAGLVRLKVDRSLGAISVSAILEFLGGHGIVPTSNSETDTVGESKSTLAERLSFQEEFEATLLKSGGGYVFLEGAHGIGKTTFCNEFEPIESSLLNLGTYSLTLQGRGAGPAVRVQPDIFFDWLLTTISKHISGKADRKVDLKYAEMVGQVTKLLDAMGRFCDERSLHGVLFIDGLNEGQTADAASLSKLIGLFPISAPKNLTIVLTAPNFNTVSNTVAPYVKSKDVITLPRLTDEACVRYCREQLRGELLSAAILDQLCQKAQGHPLYLRYLIEYINDTQDKSLQDFPTLSGSIEDYYETIWTRLLHDADAVNLLGLLTRLRWGISTDSALRMLTASEKSVFLPTMSRIRHLLRDENSTEIYHASFTDFVCDKTSKLGESAHERIAKFCSEAGDLEYCMLNVVFHLLKGGEVSELKAIATCQQKWVDDCVILGVEPDTVLADIQSTLSAAIRRAQGTEVIRLLLLQQRVGFRYNVLFAQSAYLIANSLIALKRPQEAVKVALRFNTLIVSADDAVNIAHSLIEHGFDDEAFQILKPLHRAIAEAYKSSDLNVNTFVELTRLLIQINLYAHMADGHPRYEAVGRLCQRSYEGLDATLGEKNPTFLQACVARIQSTPTSVLLYARGKYASLKSMREMEPEGELSPDYFFTLMSTLAEYSRLEAHLGYKTRPASLADLFEDCVELSTHIEDMHELLTPVALDLFAEFDAPSSLVRALGKKAEAVEPSQIFAVEKNGVDLDYSSVQQSMAAWRAAAYLNDDCALPFVEPINQEEWRRSIEQLMRAVAWCEGRARRAKADKNSELATSILEIVQGQILPVLQFSLAERVAWSQSYALPEAVIPIIWERLAVLIRDCYPEEAPYLLRTILAAAPSQLGIYTEGLRQAFKSVVECFLPSESGLSFVDEIIDLLQVWKDHVLEGVENRHELVPELLTLIPLYVRVGADEQAMDLYRHVLSVSMGPSWYKEDQFGLVTTMLSQLPISDRFGGELSKIAGYLQRASGEMTFQRFVRYVKSHFIGELFRRELVEHGCRYFQRQSCGTVEELIEDAKTGNIDRVGPLTGMRHPGGSLDDQAAVLDVVRNSKYIDWKLRWALLEIFQCGDTRHTASYAVEYAKIINGASNSDAVLQMFKRLNFVIGSEVSESERSEFFTSFRDSLDDAHDVQADALALKYPAMRADWDPHGDRKRRENAAPNVDEDPEGVRKEFVMPGTFGHRSAIDASNDLLRVAERHLKLKNYAACKSEAINALKSLQAGGWSIWGNLSSASKRAEELIREVEKNANEAIRAYEELIEGEEHAAKWSVASHLIDQVGSRFDERERGVLLEHVIDHTSLLVGDAEEDIAMFGFLDGEVGSDPTEAFFNFIIWLLEHPVWLRRDNAANALVWLIEDERYFASCVRVAFVDGVGLAGEISRGAIDAYSHLNPGLAWDRFGKAIDVTVEAEKFVDFGRKTVLLRIAERAVKNSKADAVEVVAQLKGAVRAGAIELPSGTTRQREPRWGRCIAKELTELEDLGLNTTELMIQVERELRLLCAPTSLEQSWEIEVALASSFRQHTDRPLGRWEGRVRTALSKAIAPYASLRNIEDIESVLRIYNPHVPDYTMIAGFDSPGLSMIEAIERGLGFAHVVGTADSLYLNYFEKIRVRDELKISPRYRTIEIFTALAASPYMVDEAISAAIRARCTSTSYSDQAELASVGTTCARLVPEFAYFGTFSPAQPSSYFMQVARVTARDFNRQSWRNGRSHDVLDVGTPEREGCLLSVPRAALGNLNGMKLIWMVLVDNEIVGVVDKNGREVRKV